MDFYGIKWLVCAAERFIVAASLRLVREETEPAPAVAGEEILISLETEIQTLRQEVHFLRRRDEMVHYYMHRLDEELRLAARLQQDFLPKNLPSLGPVRFHALFRPAGYVSGDLYDVFRLDETTIGFYLADAIGHGVPAALLSMFLRTSLVSKEISANGYRILTPGETMSRLNTALVGQEFSRTTFATAICGVIDTKTCVVSLACAGHPCPILMPGDPAAPVRDLDIAGGSLLGVFADENYATSTVALAPGDRMLIHSDGVDAIFEDEHGRDRWRAELGRLRRSETCNMMSEFSNRLDQLSGSLEPKDDLTVISIEVV